MKTSEADALLREHGFIPINYNENNNRTLRELSLAHNYGRVEDGVLCHLEARQPYEEGTSYAGNPDAQEITLGMFWFNLQVPHTSTIDPMYQVNVLESIEHDNHRVVVGSLPLKDPDSLSIKLWGLAGLGNRGTFLSKWERNPPLTKMFLDTLFAQNNIWDADRMVAEKFRMFHLNAYTIIHSIQKNGGFDPFSMRVGDGLVPPPQFDTVGNTHGN